MGTEGEEERGGGGGGGGRGGGEGRSWSQKILFATPQQNSCVRACSKLLLDLAQTSTSSVLHLMELHVQLMPRGPTHIKCFNDGGTDGAFG